MATKKHYCVQGDSYSYDFVPKNTTLDADWSGLWAIVDVLGNGRTSLASGSLALSGDLSALEMRIAPEDTEPIPEGSYYLVVQVSNVPASINKEIVQDSFFITPQGI